MSHRGLLVLLTVLAVGSGAPVGILDQVTSTDSNLQAVLDQHSAEDPLVTLNDYEMTHGTPSLQDIRQSAFKDHDVTPASVSLQVLTQDPLDDRSLIQTPFGGQVETQEPLNTHTFTKASSNDQSFQAVLAKLNDRQRETELLYHNQANTKYYDTRDKEVLAMAVQDNPANGRNVQVTYKQAQGGELKDLGSNQNALDPTTGRDPALQIVTGCLAFMLVAGAAVSCCYLAGKRKDGTSNRRITSISKSSPPKTSTQGLIKRNPNPLGTSINP